MYVEIAQDSELPPSFFSAELQDEGERAKTNPTDEQENSKKQRMTVPRAPETIAIRYVSNAGNDADDGLSWGTAKQTIYGALVSLPGGNTKTAGSGTVYVGNESSANPRTNAGIWLMGPKDPNYANPPAGWLKCNNCSVSVIGIANSGGGPNGHKPRVMLTAGGDSDRNHPAIWISAANGLYIANFQIRYPGRAIVMGECSNNDRTGTCGAQSIILDNVSALLSQTAGNGPCTDIASNVFWIWMRDGGCGGNAYNATGAPLSDNSAAVLIDGSAGSGSGLIYINDFQLAGGGIKVKQGSNGASLYARNVIQEGDFSHAIPPTVWFTGWSQSVDAILDNISIADGGPGSANGIENDGPIGGGGPTIFNSTGVAGPATIINQDNQIAAHQTVSPLIQGQSGFFNGYVVGQTDVARRIAGLVPTRFTNKAFSNSSNWGYSAGSTFTQNISDPFGGTGAAKIAWSTSSQQTIQLSPLNPYLPVAGDWIVAGAWTQGVAQTGGRALFTQCMDYPASKMSATLTNFGAMVGDGQWQYLWLASKVASGSATNVCVSVYYNNKLTPTLYGPTLYIIPAGTLSDNEVLEFASSMNSVDPSCQVGQICSVAGHPLVVSSYGTLSNCSSVTSPAKCDSSPAGSFVLEVGSTTARVNTTAVTANSQILVIEDSSLGAKLHASCDKTIGRTYMISDRSPGKSFTVSSSFAPTAHPACLSFHLLN